MTQPQTIAPDSIKHGGSADVPSEIATCPECQGALLAVSEEWVEKTGAPSIGGLYVDCLADQEAMNHKYWQSDWQSVIDQVAKWCGAVEI